MARAPSAFLRLGCRLRTNTGLFCAWSGFCLADILCSMEPYYLVEYRNNPATNDTDEVPIGFMLEAADEDAALEAILEPPYEYQGHKLFLGEEGLLEDGQGRKFNLMPVSEIPTIECCMDLQIGMALGDVPAQENVASILTNVLMHLNGQSIEIREEEGHDGYYFHYYFDGQLNEGDDDYDRIKALLVPGKDE
jgi:hypothetical protein